MGRWAVWAFVAGLWAVTGCTEANPLYRPDGTSPDVDAVPEGGPDVDGDWDPPDDARPDTDVPPDEGDGELDLPDGEPEADAAPDVEPEADGEPDADASPDEGDAGPEAEVLDEGGGDEATVDDRDGDGIPNGADNCADLWNPDQEDCDLDGTGDRCETGDQDGDGLADAVDVCACGAGAGVHDEDSDGLFDDCDNCPLVANALQENGDLDGLGDACEPPGEPDSHLRMLRFEPFTAVPSDPGWYVASGTWAAAGDEYGQSDDLASGTAFYDPWDSGTLGDDLYLQTVLRITSVRPGGVTKRAGLVARSVRLFTGGVRWYACVVEESADTVEIQMWDGAAYYLLAQVPAGTAVAAGPGQYRLSFRVRGSELSCALESPVAAPVIVTAADARLPLGAPGLRAYRLSASFQGLMVAR